MKLIRVGDGVITIEITQLEYDAVASALGETLGMKDLGFAVRVPSISFFCAGFARAQVPTC